MLLAPSQSLIFLRNDRFNWNKNQSYVEQISPNPSLNHLIDQGSIDHSGSKYAICEYQ